MQCVLQSIQQAGVYSTCPLLSPKYLATGSLCCMRGSWCSLSLYLWRSSFFSSAVITTCSGTYTEPTQHPGSSSQHWPEITNHACLKQAVERGRILIWAHYVCAGIPAHVLWYWSSVQPPWTALGCTWGPCPQATALRRGSFLVVPQWLHVRCSPLACAGSTCGQTHTPWEVGLGSYDTCISCHCRCTMWLSIILSTLEKFISSMTSSPWRWCHHVLLVRVRVRLTLTLIYQQQGAQWCYLHDSVQTTRYVCSYLWSWLTVWWFWFQL